jgi:hypothetical protein
MENAIPTGSWLPTELMEKIVWLETLITGVIWFYIFLRILSIIWVSRDIHARTNSTILQLVAILLVTILSPVLWLPLYITMRPVRYKPREE